MNELNFRNDFLPLKEKIFRTALRITLSRDEAEDITQDVLLRVWNLRASLSAVTSLEAYCVTMGKNLALDRVNRAEARNASLTEAEETTPDSATPTADERMFAEERRRLVARLFQTLPEKQRTALQLRDIEEHSYQEVAEIMDITEADVKVTLHRARLALKNKILKLEGNGL